MINIDKYNSNFTGSKSCRAFISLTVDLFSCYKNKDAKERKGTDAFVKDCTHIETAMAQSQVQSSELSERLL